MLAHKPVRALALVLLVAAAVLVPGRGGARLGAQAGASTTTPIKHLVVIFGENISLDHYFATYPDAANAGDGQHFVATQDTPPVNGLNGPLLTHNPNKFQPVRLAHNQVLTCDMNHDYTAEQKAVDGGLMDKFVEFTTGSAAAGSGQYCPPGITMGYYDGNTATAMWNYAQHFALNDNSYSTEFGPSTPGALGVTAGGTGGAICGPQSNAVGAIPTCDDGDPSRLACNAPTTPTACPDPPSNGTTGSITGDARPYWDMCSSAQTNPPRPANQLGALQGPNIGDLLNAANRSWGWFQGGFRIDANNTCTTKHAPTLGEQAQGLSFPAGSDPNANFNYIPHHEPFQYFKSTSNPKHLPPTSVQMIGKTDQANHQYDTKDFFAALDAGILPDVSYIKAPGYQDGHPAYSDPLDEQNFDVTVVNSLMQSKFWDSTAIVILYDDSDGWYDHAMPPIVNHSVSSKDVNCGTTSDGTPGRCGYGPRQPLLVISPFAKQNFVSHAVTDQSSVVRFIEDNWLHGQRLTTESFDNFAGTLTDMLDFAGDRHHALLLDPLTGQPTDRFHRHDDTEDGNDNGQHGRGDQ
jgi:phospholipase C